MKQTILSYLSTECPWRDTLYWYPTIDSTNTRAKQMASEGAPHGTVLIAGQQTAGRGRLGRSFDSQDGMGVYLSVLLRPQCAPEALMHLTCAAAVAMCDAVETAAGLRPGIKWTNDLVVGKKKLGGILTELSVDPKTGLVDHAIIGIGINCLQQMQDFPAELRDMALSASMAAGRAIDPCGLAAAMIESLFKIDQILLSDKVGILDRYRKDCVTIGQDIRLVRGNEERYGKAIGIDDEGALLVRYSDGSSGTVTSGEVSIRGMYGYA